LLRIEAKPFPAMQFLSASVPIYADHFHRFVALCSSFAPHPLAIPLPFRSTLCVSAAIPYSAMPMLFFSLLRFAPPMRFCSALYLLSHSDAYLFCAQRFLSVSPLYWALP